MGAIPSNVSSLVGRTPILELTRMTEGVEARLFAKLEPFALVLPRCLGLYS
jgi:cysteine synthase